jgi:hypothetical protein
VGANVGGFQWSKQRSLMRRVLWRIRLRGVRRFSR